MNLTLIIIIIALILLGLWGWFYGFIRMVCVLCSSIIIFVLTLFLAPITTNILSNSEAVHDTIYEKVAGNINLPTVDAQTAVQYFDMVGDNIPRGMESTLKEGLQGLASDVSTATNDAGDYIREEVTMMIIKILGFIVTYIVVSLLVGLLFKLFKVLSKLPVINIANKALGVVAGVALGLFLVGVFFAIVSFVSPEAFGDGIAADINSSAVLGWIYEHNILSPFVNSYLK